MIRVMKPYDLRRGTGEVVDSEYLCIGRYKLSTDDAFRNSISSLAVVSDGACLCEHILEIHERTGLNLCSSIIPRNSFRRCIDEYPKLSKPLY
jgi:hypothetical protein